MPCFGNAHSWDVVHIEECEGPVQALIALILDRSAAPAEGLVCLELKKLAFSALKRGLELKTNQS
jgi:hypothetical protein